MTSITMKPDSAQPAAERAVDLFDDWFDPVETEVRSRAREFIEELIRGELDVVLARARYGRIRMAGDQESAGVVGHRHGRRTRSLTGTFGPIEIAVPRARLNTSEGKTRKWKSQALRAYQRRTLAADALIAGSYLAGTNTRRVRRALAALFGGAVGKGHGEPGLAEGEERLGRMDRPLARRRAYCPVDPGRHGCPRAARPQGHRHLALGRARCTRRWPEGAAGDQKQGAARAPRLGGLSEFLCEAVILHARTNRSLNMTANCVFASAHSRGGRFHSAAAWFRTRYSSFAAASSEGKCPLVLTARRSFEFNASIAFVTGMRITVPTHPAGTI